MKRVCLLAALAGGLAAPAHAIEIYAMDHVAYYPSSGPDVLIRFDSANPEGYVAIGPTGLQNVGFGGLEFDRQGRLWAYATFNKFTNGASSGLYRINPETGAATVQGSISPQTLTDLGFNPVDNSMYGVFSQGYAVSRLYRINLDTGQVTQVGVFSGLMSTHNLVGIAFDSTGTLFVHDNANNIIYRVNPSLEVTSIYTFTEVTVGSQGMTIDWSRDNLGYQGLVGQGEFPNYFSTVNTFLTNGSSYLWGPSFGPNHPDGIPRVHPGDFAIKPATTCYANCDGSTNVPILNVNDFICFQAAFAAGDLYANCDGSTNIPVLNVNDFICFQSAFAAGCR